jgi:hypothetical protein
LRLIISIRRFIEWSKFILLFILFTLLLYQLIAFISPYFRSNVLYREPIGGAVKVFLQQEPEYHKLTSWENMKNRLFIFYELGE